MDELELMRSFEREIASWAADGGYRPGDPIVNEHHAAALMRAVAWLYSKYGPQE